MSRIPHPVAFKGSERWLQLAVNRCPTVIDRAIRSADIDLSDSIEWMSPLESDDFAEYLDSAFTNRLGISLERRAQIEDSDHIGRLEHLRQTNARIRFVSFEPLLGSIGSVDLVTWN